MTDITPTYKYYINTFDVLPNTNNLTNVIVKVNMFIIASYSYFTTSDVYSLSMAPPSPTSYISFSSLTNDIVQEWINASNDEYFIEKKEELKQKLIVLAAQPVITIKPPF